MKLYEKSAELRGAELALRESKATLQATVRSVDVRQNPDDDKLGIKLVQRIREHISNIEDAVYYWQKTVDFYTKEKNNKNNKRTCRDKVVK